MLGLKKPENKGLAIKLMGEDENGEPKHKSHHLKTMLDTDKDGKITLKEWKNGYEKIIKKVADDAGKIPHPPTDAKRSQSPHPSISTDNIADTNGKTNAEIALENAKKTYTEQTYTEQTNLDKSK